MHWCFAIVNGRLAELYFEVKRGKPVPMAHCYVKKEEYTTKREQQWIKKDTQNLRFSWRKGKYNRMKS